ncbi:hypothetical protein HAX54_003255 [Datura stramonium]|uniref:Uncharacterized protein n=1 Tax=Datura stramonium TaxID=4076 RepID=A0ABS8WWW1_DATST|nr:hypothetical protein [Datura stramonium]
MRWSTENNGGLFSGGFCPEVEGEEERGEAALSFAGGKEEKGEERSVVRLLGGVERMKNEIRFMGIGINMESGRVYYRP